MGTSAMLHSARLMPVAPPHRRLHAVGTPPGPPARSNLEVLLRQFPLQRHGVRRKQYLFHAGQPCRALFLVHAGCFKTCILSEDGREKITGFHLRGDLLGADSLDLPSHSCDAIALDVSAVWELPVWMLQGQQAGVLRQVTLMLAAEIRREWHWMLALGTLGAEQRVALFLLDLASRLEARGFSARHMLLRMTRAELGNFLSLQLETVTRALSRLSTSGLIVVAGREIHIEDPDGLRRLLER